MTFSPMLAVSAPATTETIDRLTGTHHFSLKIDGVRGILAINQGRVVLTNRNGVDITQRYPELAEAALAKFGTDARLILDGEVAVCDERGLPQFKLTAKRDRQSKVAVIEALSKSSPATFYAFDILYEDITDYRMMPWSWRSARLQQVMADSSASERIRLNVGSSDGHYLLAWVREHRMEGLVAKRIDSPYQSGRRSQWVKLKLTFTASAVITGREQGEGSRSETFGALTLGMYDIDNKLVSTGKVGSGFTQSELVEISARLDAGETLVGEIRFNNVGDSYNLRFPVWLGLRSDVKSSECLLAQLDGLPGAQEGTATAAGARAVLAQS